MNGYGIFAPPLFTPRGIPGTDLTVQQVIQMLEAAQSAPGATLEVLELVDSEGYLTEIADAKELADRENLGEVDRIYQRLRFEDGSDHVLTIARDGITATPIYGDYRSPAMQASKRVQEVYTDHELKPRPDVPRSTYGRKLSMQPLLGIAFPYLLALGGMDENLLGRILVMVVTTVVGLGVWKWVFTELSRSRGHWLAHQHPSLVPMTAVFSLLLVYLAASAGLSLLVFL